MLLNEGKKVVTQKFIQTGCMGSTDISEDILVHRKIMNISPLECDKDFTTCPIMLNYPASADLAAKLENKTINTELITLSTKKLSSDFDTVLIEGAGGLHVPINGLYTTLDYIQEHKLPLILVTNPKLGSVNHTFLSLEVARLRGIEVSHVLYNPLPKSSEIIEKDTRETIKKYLEKYHPTCQIIDIPIITI